jgi:hypothetical protein
MTDKPKKELARLLRFVPASAMPSDNTLTIFVAQHNLLIINKDLFDTLPKHKQYEAQRATTTLILE